MIVRTHSVVLLCSIAGYFTIINGMFLNIPSLKNKALDPFENEAEPVYPKHLEKFFRKGKNRYKKLVILDRKNKEVDEFVKKVIHVIEKNEIDQLLDKLDKRKMNCHHMSFGSINNAKAQRKLCKQEQKMYKKKNPWINFVIPIKKSVFIDPTRQGFSEDYLIDFNRRADIDFDYYNTVNRARVDNKTKKVDKQTGKVKENKETALEVNGRRLTQRLFAEARNSKSRFAVVNNRDHSSKSRGKHSKTNHADDDTDSETENEPNNDSVSDYGEPNPGKHENPTKSRQPKMKKIRDEWNDIKAMSDTASDSSEEKLKPKKQNKRNKNTYQTDDSSDNDRELTEQESKEANNRPKNNFNSDDDVEDLDLGTQEDFEPKNQKFNDKRGGSEKEKYVYMQGHRLFNINKNSDNEDSTRRKRDKNYFLPKRVIWNEDQINHLGFYWKSHEILN